MKSSVNFCKLWMSTAQDLFFGRSTTVLLDIFDVFIGIPLYVCAVVYTGKPTPINSSASRLIEIQRR